MHTSNDFLFTAFLSEVSPKHIPSTLVTKTCIHIIRIGPFTSTNKRNGNTCNGNILIYSLVLVSTKFTIFLARRLIFLCIIIFFYLASCLQTNEIIYYHYFSNYLDRKALQETHCKVVLLVNVQPLR